MTRQMQDVPGFVEAFRVEDPLPAKPYLDCDTTPSIRSRYARAKGTEAVVRQCKEMLADVTEGQIGIYASCFGSGFRGYVIKYPGQEPYFEPAQAE